MFKSPVYVSYHFGITGGEKSEKYLFSISVVTFIK